jgi:hypothetical protein
MSLIDHCLHSGLSDCRISASLVLCSAMSMRTPDQLSSGHVYPGEVFIETLGYAGMQ